MKSNQLLLWCDMETTGLDHETLCLLEASFIVTDQNLDQIGEELTLTILPDNHRWLEVMNEYVYDLHKNNGLIDAVLAKGIYVEEAQRELEDMLRAAIDYDDAKRRFVLAGSGVGPFDRRVFTKFFGDIDYFLDYYVIDVGIIRRSLEMFGLNSVIPESGNADLKPHRSLDDVRLHLTEMRHYREVFQDRLESQWRDI